MQGDCEQVVSPDIQSVISNTYAWMGTTSDDLDRKRGDASNPPDIPLFLLSSALQYDYRHQKCESRRNKQTPRGRLVRLT